VSDARREGAVKQVQVDIRVIQVLRGRKRLETTALNTLVATEVLRKVISRLETLPPSQAPRGARRPGSCRRRPHPRTRVAQSATRSPEPDPT